MAQGSFGLGRAIGRGWEGFKANPAPAILGFLVWVIVVSAISMIPIVNFAMLIVAGPLTGGLMILMLNLAKGTDPKVGDAFAGFSKFGRFLGVYWFFFLIMLLAYIPGIIGFAVGMAIQDEVITPVAMGIGGLISAVIVIVLTLKYLLVWYVVADNQEDGVMDAFRKSAQLTQGNRLKLFGSMIVLGILGEIGVLLFGVGVLLTGPIAGAAMASIYLQLKESAGGSSGAASDPASA